MAYAVNVAVVVFVDFAGCASPFLFAHGEFQPFAELFDLVVDVLFAVHGSGFLSQIGVVFSFVDGVEWFGFGFGEPVVEHPQVFVAEDPEAGGLLVAVGVEAEHD